MPFWNYPDWKANQSYARDTVVYYNSYLYVAMTDCEAGDNPLTSTYTAYFECGDFGFDKIFPSEENNFNPDNTYTRTMRKWTVADLPFSYYHAKLCGLYGEGFTYSGYGDAGQEVMVLNVYRPEGPDQGPDDPKLKYNWSGYGITRGLNSEWPESEIGELMYHISFVPIELGMPYQEGDETVSGLYWPSHLYQYNTSTFFGGNPYGAFFLPYADGTVRMSTMYYASFSRTHSFSGNPSGSASINSPAFADDYNDDIPELPETDPPTYWTLIGISPDHPD